MLLVTALTVGMIGCDSEEREHAEVRRIIRESEAIMVGYFQGDASQARTSLQRYTQLLEDARVLEPLGRTQLISLAYDPFCLYYLKFCARERI